MFQRFHSAFRRPLCVCSVLLCLQTHLWGGRVPYPTISWLHQPPPLRQPARKHSDAAYCHFPAWLWSLLCQMSSLTLIPVPDVPTTKGRISSNNLFVSLNRQSPDPARPGERVALLPANILFRQNRRRV